jgi:hypothetical protein
VESSEDGVGLYVLHESSTVYSSNNEVPQIIKLLECFDVLSQKLMFPLVVNVDNLLNCIEIARLFHMSSLLIAQEQGILTLKKQNSLEH